MVEDGYSNLSVPHKNNSENCYNCFYSRLCVILRKTILFYPAKSKIATAVMTGVKERLKEFQNFFKHAPKEFSMDPKGLTSFNIVISLIIQKYRNCPLDPEDRVMGFKNREELLEYTRSKSMEYQFHHLLGIASFEEDSVDTIRYRILQNDYDKQYKVAFLQDLIEDSIIRHKTKQNVPLVMAMKQLSNKCRIFLGPIALEILKHLSIFAAVFSFLLSPTNFLEQVLTEKSLKLREYLYIMGVGSFTLKFSWILFYLIFLLPLSFIFALFILKMPFAFTKSDQSVVFVVVSAYNICQLSFCYMLACGLSKPKSTGILISFLNIFFWMLSNALFTGASMSGATLILARVCSLHCVTPMAIAFGYITNWETIWVGAQWKNLFNSPHLADQYRGFGECLVWFTVDTFLYFIISWYLERVFPGETGVKHLPYFIFQPSYWFPRKFARKYSVVVPQQEADVEAASENAEAGIFLHNLTKIYGNNKVGVNHLNLTFFKNEITAFLGENGAGKSTTMNILVGLISATDGKAKVLDYDVHSQIDKVRHVVGFVPQYDILYPSMTVAEHLQFFGWLKGLSKSEIKQLTEPILAKLDLANRKTCITTKLSGGQKRKLSILTAYLGEPEVIILDEPTSGVDPFSRRAIWEMILQRRKNGTTILSTHFMEEADILGDRIAIIAAGELRCSGSAMHLKNRYGKGMHLVAACDPGAHNHDAVKHFVKKIIPSSVVLQEKGSDVTFAIPIELSHSPTMIEFLVSFEHQQEALSVISYGVSEPSLEEVFFAAVESKKPTAAEDLDHAENGGEIKVDEVATNGLQVTTDKISYPKQNSFNKMLWQTWGIFQKRLLYTIMSWSGYLLQIVLPMAFIVLLLVTGNQINSDEHKARLVHIWEHYRENVLFFQYPEQIGNSYIISAVENGLGPRCPHGFTGFSCDGKKNGGVESFTQNPSQVGPFQNCTCGMDFCTDAEAINQLNQIVPSTDRIYRIGRETNVTDWLIHVNTSLQTVIGGFQFQRISQEKWNSFINYLRHKNVSEKWVNLLASTTKLEYVTVWHKDGLEYGMVNAWNNLVLSSLTKNEGTLKVQMELESVWVFNMSHNFEKQIQEAENIVNSSIFLDFCFAFGIFGIAVFIQYENSTGLKHLQFLFGANPIVYWVVNLVCDLLLYMVTVGVVMLFLAIFENSHQKNLSPLLALVVPYGFLSVTFIYLLSFVFKGSKAIVIFSVISFIVFFFAAVFLSTYEIFDAACIKMCEQAPGDSAKCKSKDCTTIPWISPVAGILRIIPGFFITDGMLLIVVVKIFEKFLPTMNPFKEYMEMKFLGKRILTAYIAGGAYFILVIILESLDLRNIFSCFKCSPDSAVNPIKVVDQDVDQEAARVLQNPTTDDPLILKNVSKVQFT